MSTSCGWKGKGSRAFLNANVPLHSLYSSWEIHCSLMAFAALANGRLRRLAVRRKLEDACWRRSHAHCRRWRWRRQHAPGTQTEPQVEPATSAGVILRETGQCLLLCSLQLWQQLQRCRQTHASVQVIFTHFTFILRKQFAGNDMFLREANSYK